jgi:acyl-CoA thioester hydrolase
MPAVFEFPLLVGESSIDELGHVNNLVYLHWMVDAAMAHSTAQGWPASRHMQLGSGWVVRSHQITYLKAARAGDQVVVKTWVASGMKVTSVRRYHILRQSDQALLARAETEWAYINFQTGYPMRVPQEVAEAFIIVPDGEARK